MINANIVKQQINVRKIEADKAFGVFTCDPDLKQTTGVLLLDIMSHYLFNDNCNFIFIGNNDRGIFDEVVKLSKSLAGSVEILTYRPFGSKQTSRRTFKDIAKMIDKLSQTNLKQTVLLFEGAPFIKHAMQQAIIHYCRLYNVSYFYSYFMEEEEYDLEARQGVNLPYKNLELRSSDSGKNVITFYPMLSSSCGVANSFIRPNLYNSIKESWQVYLKHKEKLR